MVSANDVAAVILSRVGTWTDAMKLQKLLYYVQAWHLAITDEPLFPDAIKAWKDGPVVPQVWHDFKERSTRRAANQACEHIDLSQFDSDLIDAVLANYGSMSGKELGALTHAEDPWLAARGDLPEGENSRAPISAQSMARFYRSEGRLVGHTAADLAASGFPRPHGTCEPFDIDAFLAGLDPDEYADTGDDPWGGANSLPAFDGGGLLGAKPRRAAHASA